jgi:hypothetical protein
VLKWHAGREYEVVEVQFRTLLMMDDGQFHVPAHYPRGKPMVPFEKGVGLALGPLRR